MPFDSFVNRSGANTLIPQPMANEIFQGIVEDSSVLRMARRLPNMTSATLRLPILNNLPSAYFVNGDTGLKQTTSADWTDKLITAEEIAVIVPIPDAVIDDAQFDLWAQIRPLVVQAFGQVIDGAMLYGLNKPASWPNGIVTDAETAGSVIEATADTYADILGTGGLISKVETAGYAVNGYIGSMQVRGLLRSVRDDVGQPLFRQGMTGGTSYLLDAQNITFPLNGAVDNSKSMLIGGDWNQLVYAIRQDLTVKRITEGVISDAEGKIVRNLMQQDMTALRFVMRLGWQLPNPRNNIGGGAATQYPFAVLRPAE